VLDQKAYILPPAEALESCWAICSAGSQSGMRLNDLSRRGSWARLHDGRKVFEDRNGEG
jgi:hypothetical protein